jgi:hypothetical protein
MTKALDGRRLMIYMQQPTKGVMEGGWDRPRDHARTLREHDGNDEPLAEGNNDNKDEYDKDGNIPDNSAPPAESIAGLRPASQHANVPSH